MLALKWNQASVSLAVSFELNRELQIPVTQRSVLGFVSAVLDANCLLAP